VLSRKFESKKYKTIENFVILREEELTDICRADSIVRITERGEKRRVGLGV
jgi:hypothetical protein